MTTPRERRHHGRAELRVEGDESSPGMLVGNAVVYDTLSEDLGCFREKILPGAFAESLKTADVRCLIDHNSSLLLGRNGSKTLRLFDGPQALRVECDLPETSYARDLARTIRRGDLDGMSFGFIAEEDAFDFDADGCLVRTVARASIFDVSAVTYPAYTATEVSLRSLETWKGTRPPNIDPDRWATEIRRLRLKLNRSIHLPR
jgi:HK97 family phage prohead protease